MPTYFIDRSIGGRIFASILLEAGLSVEVHDAHFDQDAEDVFWIPKVAERGWIIVTADKKIRQKPHEKAAVIEAKAQMICLSSGDSRMDELAQNFVNTKAKIERFVVKTPAPFIAVLLRPGPTKKTQSPKPVPGEIRLIYPKPDA